MRISLAGTPNFAGGFSHFLVHGGQLFLVFIGFQLESTAGWAAVAAAIAAISLVAWVLALRRWRSISDTPTSQIATAAQGYAEIEGRGLALDGLPLTSPRSGLPCLWYRFMIERSGSDGKWEHEETQTSDASFIVADSSGQCVVAPEGAEILTRHKESWTEGNRRYTLWQLLREDRLYVLGQFRTQSALDLPLNRNDDTRQLLAEWKANHPQLLKRFDLDNDGQINLREWELARNAARREVEKRHRELRSHADLHLMHYPASGQLYLISNIPAAKLARRYQLLAWGHLLLFFGGLAASVHFARLSWFFA